jgi:hypothetical protein
MTDLVWYIPFPLVPLLLYLLVKRGAYRTFPCFFGYVVFGVVAVVARFLTRSHAPLYFWTYWITDVGYALFGALAMYEILRKVLRGLTGIWLIWLVFPAVVAIGVSFSLWRAHEVPPQVHGRLLLWIVVGEIAVRFMQVLVFVAMVALVTFFGFRWRQYPLGIAAGFGLHSTITLLATTKLSDIGTRFTFLWGVISLVAYSIAVLIWIGFFSVPQKEQLPLDPEVAKHYIALLERYLNVLRRTR